MSQKVNGYTVKHVKQLCSGVKGPEGLTKSGSGGTGCLGLFFLVSCWGMRTCIREAWGYREKVDVCTATGVYLRIPDSGRVATVMGARLGPWPGSVR